MVKHLNLKRKKSFSWFHWLLTLHRMYSWSICTSRTRPNGIIWAENSTCIIQTKISRCHFLTPFLCYCETQRSQHFFLPPHSYSALRTARWALMKVELYCQGPHTNVCILVLAPCSETSHSGTPPPEALICTYHMAWHHVLVGLPPWWAQHDFSLFGFPYIWHLHVNQLLLLC